MYPTRVQRSSIPSWTPQVVEPPLKVRNPLFPPPSHRLNEHRHPVGQLPQTAYHALLTPYSFFGLGRTNNYIENLFVGSTKHAPQHFLNMEGVIPNSKVVILPSSGDAPWRRQLFLRPGEWIPWVTVTVVVGTAVLAVIVLVLHISEKVRNSVALLFLSRARVLTGLGRSERTSWRDGGHRITSISMLCDRVLWSLFSVIYLMYPIIRKKKIKESVQQMKGQ